MTMAALVRPMTLDEVSIVIDYFHRASAEHLEMMGVDPTRLPSPDRWRERYAEEFAKPVSERYVSWPRMRAYGS